MSREVFRTDWKAAKKRKSLWFEYLLELICVFVVTMMLAIQL
jgi:hypothetical protein